MKPSAIPYYDDFISPQMRESLLSKARPVSGVPGLVGVGKGGGLETKEALRFLCSLYSSIQKELFQVLDQRIVDRKFIDTQTKALVEFNKTFKVDFLSPDYKTVIGMKDSKGRTVIGPLNELYCSPGGGKPIAPIPDFLKGNHVTLFGPPESAKMCINAMNAYYRKLKGEPPIVEEILKNQKNFPKWGADDEDSKTPLRSDLISAGVNLTACFNRDIDYVDPKTKVSYQLEKEKLSLPIKRFPGLALPSFFLFYEENPIPLHLYDFALHLFKNWENPEALVFYVPKLENEEEARYIKLMIERAEALIKELHPGYELGSVRLLIVLENPRAVFRVNEMIDALYPYFAGASLGWHDYLGSTARLFKEDPNYRIPVKADPDIVIKYIKASHELLAHVVGPRGGIKIGGMYGVLPISSDLKSDSFQVTIRGFFKDVITQLKRDLTGFWVAHPDFVRIGIAIVEAWRMHQKGDSSVLEGLIASLLTEKYKKEVLDFLHREDIPSLDRNNPLYERALLVSDIYESNIIANHDPEEIRYNVFQSLQYLTDWLTGNGCVALPAEIEGEPIRVMDDLATAERSRWEVWHEIYHGRFPIEDFLRIAEEELHFIRKNLSTQSKKVQVKWSEENAKWYPVALKLMLKLMTDRRPVEFATELLLPFTIEEVRENEDPWKVVSQMDPSKFFISPEIERFQFYFEACGCQSFANSQSEKPFLDLNEVKNRIYHFKKSEILEAAFFHGNIGESQKTLDAIASKEQALVLLEEEETRQELRDLGEAYLKKYGMKFLISAQGKSAGEIKNALKLRLKNSEAEEIQNAREALWQITEKRLKAHPPDSFSEKVFGLLKGRGVRGMSLAVRDRGSIQSFAFGEGVTPKTLFQVASLSKMVASAFAIDFFKTNGISLDTPVNSLFKKHGATFQIKPSKWGDLVSIRHLMSHTALNLHYVNGVSLDQPIPGIDSYPSIEAIHEPGTTFQYSGGGFLVLEHLIEKISGKKILDLTKNYLEKFGLTHFTFDGKTEISSESYAAGFLDDGTPVPQGRKIFPPFAAGALSTAEDFTSFLTQLETAYLRLSGVPGISHDTAVQMLFAKDHGSRDFMGADMGLGVFVAEAGENKLAIHQGANDGFRALCLYCFAGPDRGKGFTVFCNAELSGVLLISEVAQLILKELQFSGVDFSKFKSQFSIENRPSEQLVNLGYRELVFLAFEPRLPEPILKKGPLDPLARENLAVGAEIERVSNQRFARAENLVSPHLPIFDPELFGLEGKTMDSWETARHNEKEFDELVLNLKTPSPLTHLTLSTKYHLGNQVDAAEVEGLDVNEDLWKVLLKKTPLQGHSLAVFSLDQSHGARLYSKVRVKVFPDGGLTRLGLFNRPSELPKPGVYTDPIPNAHKPVVPLYMSSPQEIRENMESLQPGEEFDVASASYGGEILRVSNEHYGPASQLISPYPPIHMFDGFESKRSREKGHFEEVIIRLGKSVQIERVVMDFTYFLNNNPVGVELMTTIEGNEVRLIPKTLVKAYAGNKKEFLIQNKREVQEIKLILYPDGGVHRIHVYAKHRP